MLNTRKCLRRIFIGYAAAIFSIFLLAAFCGEKHWLVGLLLFLPVPGLMVPALILGSFCAKYSPRLCVGCLCMVLFILLFFMHWHWTFFSGREKKNSLSILTNNIGERRLKTLSPFLQKTRPEIMMLQDAGNRSRVLSREHSGYFVAAQGEFSLISKYEIKSSGLVSAGTDGQKPVAAWFEIEYGGQPIVLYSVHLPTPRGDLNSLRHGGILSRETRDKYKASQERRLKFAREFLEVLKKERRPFIVAGDFNMPDTGWLYRQYHGAMKDAFAAAGSGFGYTFPGGTMNPLALFRPWLRLDYIFCGGGWKPLFCCVESDRSAQHQAVFAEFELTAK